MIAIIMLYSTDYDYNTKTIIYYNDGDDDGDYKWTMQ